MKALLILLMLPSVCFAGYPCYKYNYYAPKTYSWREQITQLAKEKQETEAYLEALRALGYSHYPSNQNYTQPQVQYPEQINTSELLLRLERSNSTSMDYNREATQSLLQLTNRILEHQAEVSRIQAVTEALRKPEVLEIRATSSQASQVTQEPGTQEPGTQEPGKRQILNERCISCHNPNKLGGGLDLTVDPTDWDLIQRRVVSADPELRMPKGGTLNLDEIQTLMR